jgi:aminoglycoside phosphotransferase (APT) family kinase protein
VLVVDLIDGESLRDAAVTPEGVPPAVAAALGDALATLHSAAGEGGGDWPSGMPWALTIDRPRLEDLEWLSAGARDLIRGVQAMPDIRERLEGLRAGWRGAGLVHGDLRWDNVIADGAAAVRLVDWELAGRGDPAWDVGSVLGQLISDWAIVTQRAAGDRGAADQALARTHARAAAFTGAYLAGAEPDGPLAGAGERAAAYVGPRLLQLGIEIAVDAAPGDRNAAVHVEAAVGVMRRPAVAMTSLLGLPGFAA